MLAPERQSSSLKEVAAFQRIADFAKSQHQCLNAVFSENVARILAIRPFKMPLANKLPCFGDNRFAKRSNDIAVGDVEATFYVSFKWHWVVFQSKQEAR